MSHSRLYSTSAVYRKGHAAGLAAGREEDRTQTVIIRLIDTDGQLRIAQDVLDRLHELGWCLYKGGQGERGTGTPPTQWAYEQACAALRKWRDALSVGTWTEAERDGMAAAYKAAEEYGRGHYETLFAVGAWLLRHRAALAGASTAPAEPFIEGYFADRVAAGDRLDPATGNVVSKGETR